MVSYVKKRGYYVDLVTDPDHLWGNWISASQQKAGRACPEYRSFFRGSFSIIISIMKVNQILWQPDLVKSTNDTDPSRMKVWLLLSNKELNGNAYRSQRKHCIRSVGEW